MIGGKSASGKDQLSLYMKAHLEAQNKRVCVIHFGDLVKWLLKQCYDWNGKKDIQGRQLLQRLGTTVMREKYPTYWAEVVSKFLSATSDDFDYALIPDWRFLNEKKTICKYNKNVETIRVNRFKEYGDWYINPALTVQQAEHISETELDDYWTDWVVQNNGTMDDLNEAALELVNLIINGDMNEQ